MEGKSSQHRVQVTCRSWWMASFYHQKSNLSLTYKQKSQLTHFMWRSSAESIMIGGVKITYSLPHLSILLPLMICMQVSS